MLLDVARRALSGVVQAHGPMSCASSAQALPTHDKRDTTLPARMMDESYGANGCRASLEAPKEPVPWNAAIPLGLFASISEGRRAISFNLLLSTCNHMPSGTGQSESWPATPRTTTVWLNRMDLRFGSYHPPSGRGSILDVCSVAQCGKRIINSGSCLWTPTLTFLTKRWS